VKVISYSNGKVKVLLKNYFVVTGEFTEEITVTMEYNKQEKCYVVTNWDVVDLEPEEEISAEGNAEVDETAET